MSTVDSALGSARPPRRGRWRVGPGLVLVAVVAVVGAGAVAALAPAQSDPSSRVSVTTTPTPRLVARGRLRPLGQARVGSLSGGVLTHVVEMGQVVDEGQEVARLRGVAGGVEVLTSPRRGTVTVVPFQVGDTVAPGAVVATVGDLSRLLVETTDVDEFLVARVRRGQRVTVQVEALDRREVVGHVRSVALEPLRTATGDEHYPVVVDLADSVAELRTGMSVRVIFPED